jgi:predicted O-methyltransferase YrrM
MEEGQEKEKEMNEPMRTDKGISGLTKAYEELFARFRNEPIKYLEVGTAYGDSLVWARKFFPQATIVGADRVHPIICPDGVAFYNVDQNDSDSLILLGKEQGQFDIIIDDASHQVKETKNTFDNLYPYLKQGGLYVIEDWGAGYLPQFGNCIGTERLVLDLVWKHGGSVTKLDEGGSDNVMRGCFAVILKK